MFEIIKAGGLLMWPILISSVVAMAIILERYWTLQSQRIAPSTLLGQVWGQLRNNKMDSKAIKELRDKNLLGQVLAAGLANSRHGREVMKDSIEEACSHARHELERYLNALGTIAAITPLLGLLGTVLGMIDVFTVIVNLGTGDAGALAGGISKALITTATGLGVAIPALIFHRALQRRVDSIMVSIEQQGIRLVDALFSEKTISPQDS